MSITVEDSSNALMELLWIREAWGLELAGEDVPPLLESTPRRVGTPENAAEWEATWPLLWDSILQHHAKGSDPRMFEQIQATADGSPERARLLKALIGPSWRSTFGHSVFGDSFGEWLQQQHNEVHKKTMTPLEDSPEHRSVVALTSAWRAGLTTVITIPCIGDHTRIISSNTLLTTAGTRHAPARYTAALASFSERTGEDGPPLTRP